MLSSGRLPEVDFCGSSLPGKLVVLEFLNTAMAAVGSPSRKKNKLFKCICEEMQLLLQLFQQNPDDAFKGRQKVFPELTLILLSGRF